MSTADINHLKESGHDFWKGEARLMKPQHRAGWNPLLFTLHWKHNSPFVNTEGKQGSVSCFGGHQCMTDIHPKWRSCPVARATDIFSSAQLAWSLSVLNFNEEKGAQRIFPTKIKLLKTWNWTCSDNFLPFLFGNYEYYIFNKYFVNKISSSAKFEWIRMRKFWP